MGVIDTSGIVQVLSQKIAEQVSGLSDLNKIKLPTPEIPKLDIESPAKVADQAKTTYKKGKDAAKEKAAEAKKMAESAAKDAVNSAKKAASDAKAAGEQALEDAKKKAAETVKDLTSGASELVISLTADFSTLSSNASSIVTQTIQLIQAIVMLIPSAIGTCPLGPTFSPMIIVKGLKDLMTQGAALASLIDTTVQIINKYQKHASSVPPVKTAFSIITPILTAGAAACKVVGASCQSVQPDKSADGQGMDESKLPEVKNKNKARNCCNYLCSVRPIITEGKKMNAGNCKNFNNEDYRDFKKYSGKIECKYCKNFEEPEEEDEDD